jgi:antitoxin HicB
MEATYTVVLRREEDGRYSVSVPALPGCHTWGETLPQALHMVEEAIEGYLEVLEEDGDPWPADVQAPSDPKLPTSDFRITTYVHV